MAEKIIVPIEELESNYVERLFFEYNSILNIISYLSQMEVTKQEHIDRYFNRSVEKSIELEMVKKELAERKYKPQNISDSFNYSFDFNDNAIVYEVV